MPEASSGEAMMVPMVCAASTTEGTRAAQHWHDRPLCSNLALVGAPGWRAGSAGKPQPMATPAHQLEHPLLLHSTALACSCILPAAPQEHLHVLGNKKVHADGLAFSAPGAHCL